MILLKMTAVSESGYEYQVFLCVLLLEEQWSILIRYTECANGTGLM